MSPVSEAQLVYIESRLQNDALGIDGIGYVYVTTRRTGRSVFSFTPDFIKLIHEPVWDFKISAEALYCTSEEERFKQDVLPAINKKLGV